MEKGYILFLCLMCFFSFLFGAIAGKTIADEQVAREQKIEQAVHEVINDDDENEDKEDVYIGEYFVRGVFSLGCVNDGVGCAKDGAWVKFTNDQYQPFIGPPGWIFIHSTWNDTPYSGRWIEQKDMFMYSDVDVYDQRRKEIEGRLNYDVGTSFIELRQPTKGDGYDI